IFDDVGDLVLGQIAADRGVIEPGALRGPADLHEGEAIFHQQRDVVAGLETELAEQMRALVRELVELAIGDGLAGGGHLVGDLVRVRAGVDGGMGHASLNANSEWREANRDATSIPTRHSLLAIRPAGCSPLRVSRQSSHWPCRRLRTWSAGRNACYAASA